MTALRLGRFASSPPTTLDVHCTTDPSGGLCGKVRRAATNKGQTCIQKSIDALASGAMARPPPSGIVAESDNIRNLVLMLKAIHFTPVRQSTVPSGDLRSLSALLAYIQLCRSTCERRVGSLCSRWAKHRDAFRPSEDPQPWPTCLLLCSPSTPTANLLLCPRMTRRLATTRASPSISASIPSSSASRSSAASRPARNTSDRFGQMATRTPKIHGPQCARTGSQCP
jgi:hypothetical protein